MSEQTEIYEGMPDTTPRKADLSGSARVWSFILTFIGVAIIVFGVTRETVAPFSDTLNIGLLQDQQMIVSAGLVVFAVGVIGGFFSLLIEAVERGR